MWLLTAFIFSYIYFFIVVLFSFPFFFCSWPARRRRVCVCVVHHKGGVARCHFTAGLLIVSGCCIVFINISFLLADFIPLKRCAGWFGFACLHSWLLLPILLLVLHTHTRARARGPARRERDRARSRENMWTSDCGEGCGGRWKGRRNPRHRRPRGAIRTE